MDLFSKWRIHWGSNIKKKHITLRWQIRPGLHANGPTVGRTCDIPLHWIFNPQSFSYKYSPWKHTCPRREAIFQPSFFRVYSLYQLHQCVLFHYYCGWFRNLANRLICSLSHYPLFIGVQKHPRWWSPDFWTINSMSLSKWQQTSPAGRNPRSPPKATKNISALWAA